MKSLEERITEAMNIRLQLQTLGLLTVPHIAEILKQHTNAFVKEAQSQTFMLKEKQIVVKVLLSTSSNKKSGIELLV